MRTTIACVTAAAWLLLTLSCGCREEPSPAPSEGTAAAQSAAEPKPLYAFRLDDIDGKPTALADFRGKVLLLVNVASKCGFTKQYAGLQALHEKYRDQGLAVLAFPANNFGAQEPGTNEQIKQFCSATYGVTFPVFAKISVKGDDIHPLYRFLTSPESNPQFAGDIAWNFNKFLISRSGDVIGRYASAVEPFDQQFVADIENALARPEQ
jgi:glutathione peroxidase